MSIKYQFSAMPAQWIEDNRISAIEKFLLCALILKGNNDLSNISAIGYENLGKLAGISKRQCIRLIDNLKNLGFVEVYRNFRPAKIRVCLERVGGHVPGEAKGDTDVTFSQTKGDTDVTLTQNKRCHSEQQKVTFETKKGDMGVTLNRNIDFTRNAREGARVCACAHEEIETGDVAPVRSIPAPENPAENSAKRDIVADFAAKHEVRGSLFNGFREALSVFFKTYPYESFFALWLIRNNDLVCYFPTKFMESRSETKKSEWANWWDAAGVKLLYKNFSDFRPKDEEKIDINFYLERA